MLNVSTVTNVLYVPQKELKILNQNAHAQMTNLNLKVFVMIVMSNVRLVVPLQTIVTYVLEIEKMTQFVTAQTVLMKMEMKLAQIVTNSV